MDTRKTRCRHFRSMMDHATCAAGIVFDSVCLHKITNGERKGMPCWGADPTMNRDGATCDSYSPRTAEELDAEEKFFAKRVEMIGMARDAIVADIGKPWKRGEPGVSGTIDCPCCGKEKSLRFSRAGYNGHIHAACSTSECVSWME